MRHPQAASRTARRRQDAKWVAGALVMASIGALLGIACTHLYYAGALGPFFCPSSLPTESISGARQLAVPAPCQIDFRNHCPGVIDFIAPYDPGAEPLALPPVMFSQDGTFYTVAPADRAARALMLPSPCAGVVAPTADGEWMACVAIGISCVDCFTVCTAECFGTSIDSVSLSPADFGREHELVALQDAPPYVRYGILTWSPDSQHLAVIRSVYSKGQQGRQCDLAIFSGTPRSTPMTLSGVITFTDVSICTMDQIAWSPDGREIALLQNSSDGPGAIFLMPIASLPAPIWSGTKTTDVSLSLVPWQVLSLPELDSNPYHARAFMSWLPDGSELTISEDNGFSLIDLDTRTMQSHKLLALPGDGSPVRRFSWMPDGRRIVFSIGHNGTTFCYSPRDALYSYLASPANALPLYRPLQPTPTPTATRTTPILATPTSLTLAKVSPMHVGAGRLDTL